VSNGYLTVGLKAYRKASELNRVGLVKGRMRSGEQGNMDDTWQVETSVPDGEPRWREWTRCLNRRWLIVAGLVVFNAIHVVGSIVLVVAMEKTRFGSCDVLVKLDIILVGCYPAQGMFLALIIVFWGRRAYWWLVGLTILWGISQRLGGEDPIFWVLVMDFARSVMVSVFAATPLFLLSRFWGFELRWSQGPASGSSTGTATPGQLTIASVMRWTAAVAIILGTLSYLQTPDEEPQFWMQWVFMAWICLVPLACVTLAILWLVLRRRQLREGIIVCIAICSIPVALEIVMRSGEPLFFTGFIFCQAITFCGLRWAGLEIVRHRRDNAPQTIDGDTGGALALCEGDRP